MTTLLYGSIIQIRSTETIYENKLFFVERLEDDELVLKSNDGNIIELPIEEGSLGSSILEIIVVYKPTKGFCAQNRFFPLQWVEVIFDDQTIKGQIIKADTVIEIKMREETIYIPVERGLPKDISIKRISKPNFREEKEVLDIGEKEESPNNGELLGYIEQEDESEMVQYFYSIEQQTSDLLEHLLMYVAEADRTPLLLKKMSKTIQRYKELRSKYTDFTDGFRINRLPRDQIYSNTLAMKNKCFIPVTRDIEVNNYNASEEFINAEFFRKAPEDWLSDVADKLKKSAKFEIMKKAFDELTENQVYHSKTNTRRLKISPVTPLNTYLYDIPGLLLPYKKYSILADKPLLVHSLITPPTDYLQYSKIYDLGTSILNKSNINKTQYYSFLYKGVQHSIKDNVVSDLFVHNDYVYYENHANVFEMYLKNVTPTLKSWIEIGLDGEIIQPFYNFYQAIKQLQPVNILELQSSDYIILEAFIKMAVKGIKSKLNSNVLTQKRDYKFVEQVITTRLSTLYKEIMPKDLQTTYFSSSELLKIGEIDNYKYYKENYVKDQTLLDVTDEEISAMLDEIKAKVQAHVEEKIAKVYKTEEERTEDVSPILLKDIKGISGLEYIYQQLLEKRYKINLDRLKLMVHAIIANGLKPTSRMPVELSDSIIQYIAEIKVMDGELAYVIETKKKYAWDGKQWQDIEANPTCFIKKKLYTGQCETLEKETEYKERIVRLMKDIEQEKKRQREVDVANSTVEIQKSKSYLFSLNSKKMKHDLKYNEEKRIYAVLESQKDVTVSIVSPYILLRDKILCEKDLVFKYKAVQLFIKKYTKRGEHPFWYYCIETGAKLLPTFFHKLSDSFLVTQNYDKVIESICLEQGTLSDNGDKWVDKHSGYIIKDINFEEEGIAFETVVTEKDKQLFDDVIISELELERDINLSVKTLMFYLGVYLEENDLYSLIMKSYRAAIASVTDETQKKIIKMYAIMGHVLVYIQTHELKLGKPFPNCKASFDGFPVTDSSNINGIKYMVCVVSKLAKATPPWNILSKVPEEKMTQLIGAFLSKYIIPMIEIEELLFKRRQAPEKIEETFQSDWNRFSPRLKFGRPVEYDDRKLFLRSDYLDRIYYLSVIVQGIIHKHIAEQTLLLKDHQLTSFLINSCCDKNNYVYKYFYENTKMIEPIKEILELKHRVRIFDSLLLGDKMYFIENTRTIKSEPSSEIDEKTIYNGLIKWASMNSDIFKNFEFPTPKYNKNDSLDKKIMKMKEQGIHVTEETFLAMLQQSATIIPRQLPKDEPILIEDEIVTMLDDTDKLNNYLDKNTRDMIAKLSKLDKAFTPVLMFNTTCKHNKTNLIIPDKLEHLTHMNEILYNKINLLIHVFPGMVQSGKSALDNTVCKHWKLSSVHEEDIENMAINYYNEMLSITHDEKLKAMLESVPLDRYVGLLKIKIKNQETKNLLYHYIFVHILYDYASKKVGSGKYLKTIIQLFNREDRALNYDTLSVEYEIKLSKKSETQIKTDYFKNLSLEERKSENVLKEHKLDKWGVGLQKGMFQYVKGNYLKDKTNAQSVMDNITHDEEEISEVVVEEEGNDVGERPEDDDDAEYDEED